MEDEKVTLAAGVPDDLDGRAARARGPRPVAAAGDPVRRLGRAAGAVGGLPREDRPADPAGLGDDRDQPGRLGRPDQVARCADRSEEELADLRATAGPRRPAGRAADRRPGQRRASCRGTARRAASCRPPGRGSRRPTTTTTARRSPSPRTAGCAPATWPRSTPDGYVRLVDRTKDLVKSGGEWISLGRARERDHGPPEGRRGGRHRRSPTRSGASARWPASCPATARRSRSTSSGVPRRARAQVVDPERPRDHRRGPQDARSAAPRATSTRSRRSISPCGMPSARSPLPP